MNARLQRQIVLAAAIAGCTGVLIGAFGAHGLDSALESLGYDQEWIEKRVDQFEVGVRYHLVHAVALLGLAPIVPLGPLIARWSARLMIAGLILFSGSLYLLVLTNTPVLGAITPLGGLAWIIGWAILAAMIRQRPNPDEHASERKSPTDS